MEKKVKGKKVSLIIGIIVVVIAITGTLLLLGPQAGKGKRVAIIQFASHPALDATVEGFKEALREAGYEVNKNVIFDLKNSEGDYPTAVIICKQFVSTKPDILFAIATPAAQAAAKSTTDIPVVYAAVTDPVASGLVKSMENSGNNVTGVSDMYPVDAQVELIREIKPDAKRIGIIYNPAETNSVVLAKKAEEACNSKGMELITAAISKSAEVYAAASSLVGRVDVLFVCGDNAAVSGLEAVIKVGRQNNIPLFVGDEDSVKRGAVATVGTSYFEVGKAAGEKAVLVLQGREPSSIPSSLAKRFSTIVNPSAAKDFGLELPTQFLDSKKVTIVKGK